MNAVNTPRFTEAGFMAMPAAMPGFAVPSRTPLDQTSKGGLELVRCGPFPGDTTLLTFCARQAGPVLRGMWSGGLVSVATPGCSDPNLRVGWSACSPLPVDHAVIHHCLHGRSNRPNGRGKILRAGRPGSPQRQAKEAYRRITMAAYLDSMEFEPDEL